MNEVTRLMMAEEFFAKSRREADDVKTSGRLAALDQKIIQLADDKNGHEPWQVQVIAALWFQDFSEYNALKKAYARNGIRCILNCMESQKSSRNIYMV
jgi:hypothetical protein